MLGPTSGSSMVKIQCPPRLTTEGSELPWGQEPRISNDNPYEHLLF